MTSRVWVTAIAVALAGAAGVTAAPAYGQSPASPQDNPPVAEVIPEQPSKRASAASVVAQVPLPPETDRRVVTINNTADGPKIEAVTVTSAAAAVGAVKDAQKSPEVAAVAIDTRVRVKTDYTGSQWALSDLNATATWTMSTGSGVKVAVVDTGVQATHPDLSGRVLSGAEFVSGGGVSTGNGQDDQNGHGTHVSGIIAADRDGDLVTGIAPSSSILPVRVLDSSGSGWNSDVDAGIIWAADNGADVINLSLGGSSSSSVDAAAISYAVNTKHVAVFAAAGNGGAGASPNYPAAYPGAVGVSAVDSSNTIAGFSNRGSYVDLAAPGVSIISDYPTSTVATMSGTSMATPYASGSAAVALSALRGRNPAATGTEVTGALQSTATDLGAAGRDDNYGHGLVNPYAAIMSLGGSPPTPAPTPTPTPTPTPAPTPTPTPTPAAPGMPLGVSAVARAAAITVRFTPPASAGSAAVTRYEVRCVSNRAAARDYVGNSNLRGVTFLRVKRPTTYRCAVRAGNPAWGSWSGGVKARAKARRR